MAGILPLFLLVAPLVIAFWDLGHMANEGRSKPGNRSAEAFR